MLRSADSDLYIYYVMEVVDCFGNDKAIFAGAASPEGRTKLIRIDNNRNICAKIDKPQQHVDPVGPDSKNEESNDGCENVCNILSQSIFNTSQISSNRMGTSYKPGFFC
ncbi:hypothetical protein BMR1_03g00435 [Babesia microti strain RI]|uniref:Uncharacterized protein n=1 Tax=Babesia microti (strain RI) TaxID=1133968 RepID=A0A0K3AM87_BABMR|nr:hypothetical protein BMR1_03g00435 [Babesia microti strain RI]CTQ40687.1 hypothetical protein BMR1_03g00435 [Babesia microti strain RI]|eukprot:XP_012648698.1 hypothetical protein BMR1_03g00435 [Babesia microti strain RI]